MAKQTRGELVVLQGGYDYERLEATVADEVRSATERIRQKVKRTIEDIIDVGKELLAVKEALPHGQFGKWLQDEFGWTERTARNFMGVAEGFGGKTEIISDLRIDPTAAYVLAAPSAPDGACEKAIERAEAGERITTGVAKEILERLRKKAGRRGKVVDGAALTSKLVRLLERFRQRWNPKELSEFAVVLREFADSVDAKPARSKKGKE